MQRQVIEAPAENTAPEPGKGGRRWVRRLTPSRFAWLLLLTLLTGALLQGIIAANEWGTTGEGQYIQAGLSVANGGIPLITFPARPEPTIIYALAAAFVVFGSSQIVARGVLILFNVLTAGFIALIARRLSLPSPEAAGIAAAALYLLYPLAIQQSTLIGEEPVSALFIAGTLYFILRDRRSPNSINFWIAGMFLGLAVLSRRSAAAVGLVWMVWILYTEPTWRKRLYGWITCLLPGALMLGGYFLWVAKTSSFAWALSAFFGTSAPYSELYIPVVFRVEIFGYLMMVAAPFFLVPIALFLGILRAGRNSTRSWIYLGVSSGVVVTLLGLLPFEENYGLTEVATPYTWDLVALALVIWGGLMVYEVFFHPDPRTARGRESLLVAGAAIGYLGADFLLRTQPFVTYSGDAMAPLAALFGVWFATLVPHGSGGRAATALPRRSRTRVAPYAPIGLIVLLIVSASLTAVWLMGPTSDQNGVGSSNLRALDIYRYDPTQVQQVGNYLKGVMKPSDTIFTFDTLFADAAGKVISPNMAQYIDPYLDYLGMNAGGGRGAVYLPAGPVNESPYPAAPPGQIPSVRGLIDEWNQTNVTWFPVGYITQAVEYHSPLINDYIHRNYYAVTSFGSEQAMDYVVILHRGQPPRPVATQVGDVSTDPGAVSVTSMDGNFYSVSLDSPNLTYWDSSGGSGVHPLAFSGGRLIASYFQRLWIGSTISAQIEIAGPNGQVEEVLPTGSGPSAIAVDPATREVFVSSVTGEEVSAFADASNGTWWTPAWTVNLGSNVTGLTLDPTTGTIYAALPNQDAVDLLQESNGNLTSVMSLPFPPFSIIYANGSLVASWWMGTIFQLNLSSSSPMPVVGEQYVGGPIPELDYVPFLDAVAIPSETNNSVTFLNVQSLFRMGSFEHVACPGSVAWNGTLRELGMASRCISALTIWSLPPPVELTLTGAPGATVTQDGIDSTDIALPTSMYLWPQEMLFEITQPGFFIGTFQTTIWGNMTITLTPGPSLQSVQELQERYLDEVGVVLTLVTVATVVLLRKARVDGPRPSVTGESPGAPTQPADDPPKDR